MGRAKVKTLEGFNSRPAKSRLGEQVGQELKGGASRRGEQKQKLKKACKQAGRAKAKTQNGLQKGGASRWGEQKQKLKKTLKRWGEQVGRAKAKTQKGL